MPCHPASCAGNRQDRWSDSSLLEKRLSECSIRHQLLQQWASMSSAFASEAEPEPERCEEKAAAAAGDYPLVFLCARCRRPLGDSLTWVTSQEDKSCILLSCQFWLGPVASSPAGGLPGVGWGGREQTGRRGVLSVAHEGRVQKGLG